uniref:MAM domain-containing protein n=1 Tax=Heterorhabditis bacteriophora TaxID=37862 RepID=A0A1I7XM99_HETBA
MFHYTGICTEILTSSSDYKFIGILCCFPTSQRQFQHGAPNVRFEEPPAAPQASQALPGARVAAAGKSPNQPIVDSKSSSLQSLLGERVSLSEFSADGYNAEGGGPVNSGNALTCNFDDRPCCWANVPPPDDQLDWQVATGAPDKTIFPTSPDPEGSYLVAYARAAAPSDEAQFASCSIGCSASDITIRAKYIDNENYLLCRTVFNFLNINKIYNTFFRHWTSENVLLQVCLRESFPNAGVIHNPLLNCQEFPAANGLTVSELVLPKTSLVDVVFVASNFIGEKGDMAILDDIEVSYDRNGPECDATTEQEIRGTTQPQTVEMGNQKTAVLEEKSSSTMKVNGIKLPEEVRKNN